MKGRKIIRITVMYGLAMVAVLALAAGLWATGAGASDGRGLQIVPIKDRAGRNVGLYKGSYALLVGVSDYTTREWPDLESIPSEIAQVASVLEAQGFHVKKVMNPTSRQMKKAFEDFIDDYGFDANNRLIFFFSGHGYTRKGGRKGYLVPADAPDPRSDEKGFSRKALNMSQVMAWCRRIEAKHALFLFDSCFSGAIFKVKALPSHPPHISDYTARPVRQFITAGSAGEEVPAQSIFTPLVLRALRGDADVDKDGYVTGTELGMYLHKRVLHYDRGQTPQYGKMKDPFYDEGDFVFQLASSSATVTKPDSSRKTTLSVSANVTGARVMVDGRSVGKTPLEDKALSPGTHRLRVEADGYDAYEKRIRVESGRAVSLYVDLSEAAPSQGRIFVETTPGDALVRILNIGPAFYQGMDLEPGRYHVEVSSDGYETEKRWVSLSAGEDETVSMRLTAVRVVQPVVPRPELGGKKRNSLGMEFIYVSPGSFMMGSSGKQHRVTLTRGYYMQATEVTQGQWRKVMGSRPWSGKDYVQENANNAAAYISWNDCQAFIRKLNQMEGSNKYRLPTEAEWEYAARAGSNTRFCFGDSDGQLGNYAWYNKNAWDVGDKYAHGVGTKRPNAWGFYDMHGNVWEWCQDWSGNYPSGSVTDPTGPSSGSDRVYRGGSWYGGAGLCRSALRGGLDPGSRYFDLGFRLAFSPGQ
jgi:formylglycine-generating enzyme required for sulfatase activity